MHPPEQEAAAAPSAPAPGVSGKAKEGAPAPESFPQLTNFIYYISAECAHAHNTVLAYERDMLQFAAYIFWEGKNRPEEVEAEDIVGFIGWLSERGLEPVSRARMLVTVRMFFRFLIVEKLIPAHDPCAAIDQPKLGRYLPAELSPPEVEDLLRAEDGHDLLSVRNRAILETFYATGARVSEVCALRVLDVDLAQQKIRINNGKGSKQRLCPLGLAARQALSYYVDMRSLLEHGKRSPYFFLSKSGKKLGRESVFRAVKAAALKAGIGKNVYPHLLRHSFATHMLAGGANLRAVQELLGHADLATTEIYTHVGDRQKDDAYRTFHPRA